MLESSLSVPDTWASALIGTKEESLCGWNVLQVVVKIVLEQSNHASYQARSSVAVKAIVFFGRFHELEFIRN